MVKIWQIIGDYIDKFCFAWSINRRREVMDLNYSNDSLSPKYGNSTMDKWRNGLVWVRLQADSDHRNPTEGPSGLRERINFKDNNVICEE